MAAPAIALAQGTRRVREAADIATVISQYVPLKKSGINMVGLCPFHSEKSPSFVVSRTKQLFHCKGCGVGGDVLTFVEKIEGVNFMRARRSLAEQYGVALEDRRLTPKERAIEAHKADLLRRLHEDAALLWGHARRRYRERLGFLWQMATAMSERGWEPEYQVYARRAWRWGKLIRRLDDMGPTERADRFMRLRLRRRTVMDIVRGEAAMEARADESWGLIVGKAAAGELTEEQFMTVVMVLCAVGAHVEAGSRERAAEALEARRA